MGSMYAKFVNYFFEGGLKTALVSGITISVFIASIVCIGLILFFTIKKMKKEGITCVMTIVLAVILSCIIMIPATLSINGFIKIRVKEQIRNTTEEELKNIKLEIENQQLVKENLEKQNKIIEQDIQMNTLNKQVNLLKASQVSAMEFQKIAEVALIQTEIEQTKAWNGAVSELQTGWGIKADYYQDEYLVVNTYDINAKYGIDFNKIKIKKINNNKIYVSGIKPTYIGASKNQGTSIIKEIRRNDYDSKGRLKKTNVLNDTASLNTASTIENELDKQYQESLQNMDNWEYLKTPIVALGQNFIKMIFSPIYKEIVFVDSDDESFSSIRDYISNEIKNGEEKVKELSGSLDMLKFAEEKQSE